MQIAKRRANGTLLMLPPELIRPNPGQPRRQFDRESLQSLAASIAQHGLLQPLSVRREGGGYELVAGERRLRAARMAGLTEVPCLVLNLDEQQSSLAALVENLQRQDLDCWEQAEGIARLIRLYGLSQEQAAARLGMSPSALANKLRLLKHSPAVRAALREAGLSERHARALLRISGEERQLEAIRVVVQRGLNVAQTEAYLDSLQAPRPKPRRAPRVRLRDLRLFLNSLDRHLETLRQAGIPAGLERAETEEALVLTITLPKEQKADAQGTKAD